MFTIEDVKQSGILASLAQRSKFPFVEVSVYDDSYDGIVYTTKNAETDEGCMLCDLTSLSFDNRFDSNFMDRLWKDWMVYAVIPSSKADKSHLVFRPLNEDAYPDMDFIRICEGKIYWNDDSWFLGEEAYQAKLEREERERKRLAKEREAWRSSYGEGLSSHVCANDYPSKPQDEWNEEDWNAFKEHSVPHAALDWEDWETVSEICFYENPPIYRSRVELIDVSGWDQLDWCYYWYVNGLFNPSRNLREYRFRLDEGFAWTERQSSKPNLERLRVRREEYFNYRNTQGRYFSPNIEGWMYTPYGNLSIQRTPLAWRFNVGIPFVYAHTGDYEVWLKANLDAQRAAIELYGGTETPVALTPGWMGNEMEPPSSSLFDEAAEEETEDDGSVEEASSGKKFTLPFFRSR